MVYKIWGIDPHKPRWLPATVHLTEQTPKETFETLSADGWLILHDGIDPNDGRIDLETKALVCMGEIATLYPGIILYGAERFSNMPVSLQDGFWEFVGQIGLREQNNRSKRRIEALEQQIAQIKEPKRVPPVIQKYYTQYRGKVLDMIPGDKLAKIKKWYILDETDILEGEPKL